MPKNNQDPDDEWFRGLLIIFLIGMLSYLAYETFFKKKEIAEVKCTVVKNA